MSVRVLIVDDDAGLRRALRDRFAYWGHKVDEASDGRDAIEKTASGSYDLVILDLYMPGMTGMEVLKEWKQAGFEAPVVVLTAQGSVEAAVEAMRAGAEDFLQKPADFELLQRVVERSIERRRLQRQNRALVERLTETTGFVAGGSRAMKSLLTTAARAAQANATILLTGESGTGKQVVAEYIHGQSPRAAGPFIYVNCVALSDELIESTLFGHERGAFTGAVARKEGRLEAAAGGTAFLDEVGDITPRLQTKLLHFLETGHFERVGGTRTLSVDCRILAATNRDLPEAVRRGDFREDLYYRLNVVHLHVPALRERREDIPVLALAFLQRFVTELGRGSLGFAPQTLEILERHPWPGNVRQLKNAVERMAVLAPGEVLTPDLLPPELLHVETGGSPLAVDRPLKDALLDFKREYVRAVLGACGGNQTRAAERLGLQRPNLNRLKKELGL